MQNNRVMIDFNHHGKEEPSKIDFDRVKAIATNNMEMVLHRWLPGGKLHGREYTCGGVQGGPGDSCSTNITTGVGSDFATGQTWGDVIELVAMTEKLSMAEAARKLEAFFDITSSTPTPPPIPKQTEAEKLEHALRVSAALWVEGESCPPAHPYLVKKQVNADPGIRYHPGTGALLIPLRSGGDITGVQRIFPDGTKKVNDGGKFKGACHIIPGDSGMVYICEGYATAMTVNMATGGTVVMTVSSGNMPAVAVKISEMYPAARLIFAADNDNTTPKPGQMKNPGLTMAAKAVELIGRGTVIAPPAEPETKIDWNDYAIVHGGKATRELLTVKAATVEGNQQDKTKLPPLTSMTELLSTTFKPIRWVIPDLLPEGLAILSGPPKIGKSWMVMNLCIAMTTGGYVFGKFPVERAEVILLSLEDNERRLQDRSRKCLAGENLNLDSLHATTTWNRLDKGGLDDLEGWLKRLPGCSLVVIDTIQKIKPPSRKNSTAYESDYDTYGCLQQMALKYRCCILIIHHNRKSDSRNVEDPLEQISGSTGTTGSMDTILMLRRPRGATGAVLTATGRDIAEAEYGMTFDGTLGQWVVSGQAAELSIKENSNASMILDFMKARPGEEFTIQEVFEALEERIKWDTIKRELYRLVNKNVVTNHRGRFSYHVPISTVSPVSLVTQ